MAEVKELTSLERKIRIIDGITSDSPKKEKVPLSELFIFKLADDPILCEKEGDKLRLAISKWRKIWQIIHNDELNERKMLYSNHCETSSDPEKFTKAGREEF